MNTRPMTLKSLRERRGLRQKDIAEKMAIDVMTYSHWENGNRTVGIDLSLPLAEALSVSVPVLIYILLGKMPEFDHIYRSDYVSFPVGEVIYKRLVEQTAYKGRIVMAPDDFIAYEMLREYRLRSFGKLTDMDVIMFILNHGLLEITRQGKTVLIDDIMNEMEVYDLEFREITLPHTQSISFSNFIKDSYCF